MSDMLFSDSQDTSARTLTMILYVLYALGLFTLITAIVAIIINYVKKEDMRGTLYESHFRWQIRTFWFSLLILFLLLLLNVLLLFGLVGVTVSVLTGSAVFAALTGLGAVLALELVAVLVFVIWYIYRIIKGGLRLTGNKPMYMSV
jgi:uncharacterized membrane protein